MNRPWWVLPALTIPLGVVLIEPLPLVLHFGRYDNQQLTILVLLAVGGAGMVAFGMVEFLRHARAGRLRAIRFGLTRGQIIEGLIVTAFFVWLTWAEWPHFLSAWNSVSP